MIRDHKNKQKVKIQLAGYWHQRPTDLPTSPSFASIWPKATSSRLLKVRSAIIYYTRPWPAGPRMDHRVVTSPGFVNVSRLASRLRRSARMGIFLDAIASPSTYPSDLPQAKVSRNRRKRFLPFLDTFCCFSCFLPFLDTFCCLSCFLTPFPFFLESKV